jgi:hypothetical protein
MSCSDQTFWRTCRLHLQDGTVIFGHWRSCSQEIVSNVYHSWLVKYVSVYQYGNLLWGKVQRKITWKDSWRQDFIQLSQEGGRAVSFLASTVGLTRLHVARNWKCRRTRRIWGNWWKATWWWKQAERWRCVCCRHMFSLVQVSELLVLDSRNCP